MVGLKTVVETLLDEQLCKGEQISDWDRRPLTKSQLHYAALDAQVLIELTLAVSENAVKANHEIDRFCKTLTLKKQKQQQQQDP